MSIKNFGMMQGQTEECSFAVWVFRVRLVNKKVPMIL